LVQSLLFWRFAITHISLERTLTLKNKITGVNTRKANICIKVTMRGVQETSFHGKALSIRYFGCVF